jgi:hypothetical protein
LNGSAEFSVGDFTVVIQVDAGEHSVSKLFAGHATQQGLSINSSLSHNLDEILSKVRELLLVQKTGFVGIVRVESVQNFSLVVLASKSFDQFAF